MNDLTYQTVFIATSRTEVRIANHACPLSMDEVGRTTYSQINTESISQATQDVVWAIHDTLEEWWR